MATLPAEQQLIADRLATGGMPGMRKAIADEQERLFAAGVGIVQLRLDRLLLAGH